MQINRMVMPVMMLALAAGSAALVVVGCAKAAGEEKTSAQGAKPAVMASGSAGDPYPLTTCPVSEAELGSMGDPIVFDHNGREIKFCCKGCISKFEADPDKYLKEVDARIIAEQQVSYPLDTCIVSGGELGGMGKVVDYVHGNRLTRLCCGGCINKVKKDPAAYIGKLDTAVVEAQLASYPLDTCVVTGEKLGSMGDPIEHVFANQLVRFCCKGCVSKFEADPAKYIAKVS